MKFKLFFDDSIGSLTVNCLSTTSEKTILPKNVSEHVHYPIPNKFNELIKCDLLNMLNVELNTEFKDISAEIEKLTKRRTELLKQARIDTNPKIIETCELFKVNHAEHFI